MREHSPRINPPDSTPGPRLASLLWRNYVEAFLETEFWEIGRSRSDWSFFDEAGTWLGRGAKRRCANTALDLLCVSAWIFVGLRDSLLPDRGRRQRRWQKTFHLGHLLTYPAQGGEQRNRRCRGR